MEGDVYFRVLTFNTWLLKTPFGYGTALHYESRIQLIPPMLSSTGAEIICLQEVWGRKTRSRLIRAFKKLGYPYHAYRARTAGWNPMEILRGLFGNGLLMISKFPLDKKIKQLRFSKHTRAEERAVIKGAIKTRVLLPEVGWADLYNSHLGAVSYDPREQEYHGEESEARFHQAHELHQWIPHTRSSEAMILTVDLNTHYQKFSKGLYIAEPSPEYHLLAGERPAGLHLVDTHQHIHSKKREPGWTYDRENPYISQGFFPNQPRQVVDYIFMSNSILIEAVDSKVVFKEQVPFTADNNIISLHPPRLSDHYGILTTFRIKLSK